MMSRSYTFHTLRALGAALLFTVAAWPACAQPINSVSNRFIADQGQAGVLRIGMSLASLERALRKKIKLHPAATNKAGAMLEINDLASLGISRIYDLPVEGVDVFFVENPRKQLKVEMFAFILQCSALVEMEKLFELQTAASLRTSAGLPYRVSENGKYAFALQDKPVCGFWIRHV